MVGCGTPRVRERLKARSAGSPVAQLLAQPPDARLELGLLGLRRAAGGLTVGACRGRHVAGTHTCAASAFQARHVRGFSGAWVAEIQAWMAAGSSSSR